MIKTKLTIIIILLFIMLPGCLRNQGYLVRYGEDRLNQLRMSVNKLQRECQDNNVELTEAKIKERLGKPGFLKPIYETNLDLSFLDNLERDSGVSLIPISLIPNRADLYRVMSDERDNGNLESVKLLSYVYDRMGLEDPSLTFYIGSFKGAGEDESKVLGWDYVKYGTETRCNFEGEENVFINYDKIGSTDYLRLSYTILADTVIGLKQFVGEIIKSPISFLEAEFIKNIFFEKKIPFYKFDGFKAAAEDWRNGVTALTYRHRVDGKQGILATTQNLLGEVPIVGSFLDQRYKNDSGTANKLFLTRGIYGGNDSAQNMALWAHYLKSPPVQECPPVQSDSITPDIKVIPYRYGSGTDVFWAVLNLSHGYAYEMASEIVSKCDVRPGHSVLLSGHSGGVQRNFATARILNDDGIKVKKVHGIAGPAMGYAPCDKIKVVLNGKLRQDPVSGVSRLLTLFTNAKWEYIKEPEKRHRHRTPGFYDGKTRLKYDGFLCDNFEYLFK